MYRELVFMSVQPDEPVFAWEIEVFVKSTRQLGYKNKIEVLILIPHDRVEHGPSESILKTEATCKQYDNVHFHYYSDYDGYVKKMINISAYIPILRPILLMWHFTKYPALKNCAVFYHDSDIVFTRFVDFESLTGDESCYLSKTGAYMDTIYFERTKRNVLPHLSVIYEPKKIMNACANCAGITYDICAINNDGTGGAQSILKNIDGDFWKEVTTTIICLRNKISFEKGGINYKFFKSEQAGIQSWCADMWALLWCLWARECKTETPEIMDFCWATDPIEKWNQVPIYHDAGVGSDNENYLFHKRSPLMLMGANPQNIDTSYVSNQYCSYRYCQLLKSTLSEKLKE